MEQCRIVVTPTDRLRIIVLGYIVRGPLGGMSWHYLQYVMGLNRLGHDVYFVEDSDDYPSCYDPTRHVTDTDSTYGLQYAQSTFERVGLARRWAYHDAHTATWHGPCAEHMPTLCKGADLLLNISGANPLRPWLMEIPVRALIDTDPVFEQIRQLTLPERRELARQHTVFLSFGEGINRQGSPVPDDGLPWQATRQPIVLDAWPVTPGPAEGKFTTVMQWDSYPVQEYGGCRYGMKSDSFKVYMDLPKKVGPVLQLALGGSSAPRDLLRSKGWDLIDPLATTRDILAYQDYIRSSKAEFGVAKHGYVAGRSGWFSERSAAYLASGRPVLTQETGFSDWMETGSGVIPFSTPEEALWGIDEINSNYEFHCRAAREVAEEYFDARKVLPHLLDSALNKSQEVTRGSEE